MTPAEAAFARIPFKLASLLQEAETLHAAEAKRLRSLSRGDDVDVWIAKTARASGIESLFTGMEDVLKTALGIVGEKVASTAELGDHHFHAQLIAQAATPTSARPAIISETLRLAMDDLRKFRHMERNNYGYVLDPDRVAQKAAVTLEIVTLFRREIENFVSRMST